VIPNQETPNQSPDPRGETDPPLALALQQLNWFAKYRGWARNSYYANEVLILLTAAATTVAAALQASPLVTASLAASSLVLTGLRKVFDSHENWMAFSHAWAELRAAIYDYWVLPEDQRDEKAQKSLVSKVNEVVTAETDRWAFRRRSLSQGSK